MTVSLRRLLGTALVVFGAAPLFRLLDPVETGLAGEFTARFMEIHLDFVWYGLLLMLPVAIAVGRFAPDSIERHAAAPGTWLASLPFPALLAGLGGVSMLLGAGFSLGVLEGKPNLIDSYAQLLHARYWAAGMLAGPASDGGGFWAIQNSLFTERGWVSQYPPGHIAWLALFLVLGVPWLAGPVLMAVAVIFATAAADRLLPGRRHTVLAGGALLAVSPFFVAIGASYMNHVMTAAMVSVGAWALVRAWQGRAAWALLAGAAFGWSLATRPLSTTAMAAALALFVPFAVHPRPGLRRFASRAGLMAAGALPFLLLLFAYNRHFFGSGLVFGYQVAMGPQMRLGFLRDPWGNLYGLREAVAYTNADLMALGVNLFESPLSAVLVVGCFLILARRLAPGERVLAAWALLPVLANFFYWHHGHYMGPRMLHEAAPAWTFLFVTAAAGLVQLTPPRTIAGRYRPRAALLGTVVVATAIGLLVMAPQRLLSYGGDWHDIARTPVPQPGEPALVFVHDAWPSRIAMTLVSAGYRLDLIETLMRQNTTCTMQRVADLVAAGDRNAARALIARLDTVPRAASALPAVAIAPGAHIRVRDGEPLGPDCLIQAHSNRHGILDIAPLLWRADLHGVAGGSGTLIARDLGPLRNAALIAAHPDRRAWIYMMPDTAAREPVLLPYDDGMRVLWGAAAATHWEVQVGAADGLLLTGSLRPAPPAAGGEE